MKKETSDALSDWIGVLRECISGVEVRSSFSNAVLPLPEPYENLKENGFIVIAKNKTLITTKGIELLARLEEIEERRKRSYIFMSNASKFFWILFGALVSTVPELILFFALGKGY